MVRAGIGFRAIKGGAITVSLALDEGEPLILFSDFLATAAEGDRLALEPYQVAFEAPRGPDGRASDQARAAVTEGRARQDRLAALGLNDLLQRLREKGAEPGTAALVVNRAGWVTELLDYSLAFADHPPVAEGLAVREALRSALRQVGLGFIEMDEKNLPGLASEVLDMSPSAIDDKLKALGAVAGKPWRKEQKLACLSAWVALGSIS